MSYFVEASRGAVGGPSVAWCWVRSDVLRLHGGCLLRYFLVVKNEALADDAVFSPRYFRRYTHVVTKPLGKSSWASCCMEYCCPKGGARRSNEHGALAPRGAGRKASREVGAICCLGKTPLSPHGTP